MKTTKTTKPISAAIVDTAPDELTAQQDAVCGDYCPVCKAIIPACIVCGKGYCTLCEAVILGCIHRVPVCRNCDDRADVLKVVKRFATALASILRRRAKALVALPRSPIKNRKSKI